MFFLCLLFSCQIVQSLVLCHLDYCSTVWSSAASGDLRRLQVVQNRAARLVLNRPLRANVDHMHACLSWLTVENRLSFNTLLMFKTVMSSQTPLFIISQSVLSNTVHGHDTRGSRNGQLVLPCPKSNSLKRSLIYRSLSLWNDLPRHLCSINSKLTFKKHLRFHLIQ